MAGYAIINNEITDEALHAEFRDKVAATIEAHGGRYLVRGGATEVMDGDFTPGHVVVVEFDSVDQARAWQTSPEYIEAKKMRTKAANANVIIVEGV
ncbi:MAG: DUF1330 domain-containing protein [Acidimicrobiaceae bacterium]|nr:DUF1330 domain-containing protein [Acidimicrobiaceae bacterium]